MLMIKQEKILKNLVKEQYKSWVVLKIKEIKIRYTIVTKIKNQCTKCH
jgi:hypothetical protein